MSHRTKCDGSFLDRENGPASPLDRKLKVSFLFFSSSKQIPQKDNESVSWMSFAKSHTFRASVNQRDVLSVQASDWSRTAWTLPLLCFLFFSLKVIWVATERRPRSARWTFRLKRSHKTWLALKAAVVCVVKGGGGGGVSAVSEACTGGWCHLTQSGQITQFEETCWRCFDDKQQKLRLFSCLIRGIISRSVYVKTHLNIQFISIMDYNGCVHRVSR